ncbi:peroxiredoxin-like family protein [Marinifilum sp.]|uniref:peroxiredoxin-like family protein n=1 Tax=Marinifilum sp. TaxID=2033137 RepID=UPI003BAC9B43
MKKLIGLLILLISFTSYGQRENSTVKVGDKAPMFKAKDQHGNVVKSSDILKNEQLIVVFYRGQWCPLCNKHLSHLQDHVEDFKQAGAQLLAISPEVPVNVSKTVKKTNAHYPILYDKDSKIMKEYAVEFMLPENLQKKYKGYGIDLTVANGNNDQLLPVPATYIIGKNGKVKYVHYDPDYKNRSNAEDILKHL